MRKLLAIVILTFKEEMHSKLLFISLFIALVCVGSSKLFTSITPGAEKAFVTDISFTLIGWIVSICTIVVVSDIIYKEVTNRTIFILRTNPVNSLQIILGKYLGLAFSLGLALLIMELIYLGVFYYYFRTVMNDIGVLFLFTYIKVLIIVSIGVLGATIFSRITNVLFCVSILIMGNLTEQIHQIAERAQSDFSKQIIEWSMKVIPDFSKYRVLEYVAVEVDYPRNMIVDGVIYGSIYIFITLFLAVLAYRLNDRLMEP
ncbi:MAG: hypothetical protein P9M03_04030 [Candidatus Theseobacter exili]|nr:hypothetical protein [Candidatus Theseobacter exili]